MKILITEDSDADSKFLMQTLTRLGYETVQAKDGLDAIRLFGEDAPDMALLDIAVPECDGIETIRRIRALKTGKNTPLVVLSLPDQPLDIIRCLEAGADDYLAKPISFELLRAKLQSYAIPINQQHEIVLYNRELELWRAREEEQERLGLHVMSRLTKAEGLRDAIIGHFNLPAAVFSGDLLCAARAPGEIMNVLLADATGHGLPAALSAMPITQVFYSMTAKGFPLSAIAEELNRKLESILPADHFVAATLGSIDIPGQSIEIWNGGNPDTLFVTREGKVAAQWPSRYPPLGILPPSQFNSLTETMVFQEPGDLILSSDGLFEAESPKGVALGMDHLLQLASGNCDSHQRLSNILAGVRNHIQGDAGHDDISCLMVCVPIERRRQLRLPTPTEFKRARLEDWRFEICYTAVELHQIDVVPQIIDTLRQVPEVESHQSAIFLIVSELFNNALDHGLLKLNSSMKKMIGGFEIYLNERAKRLGALRRGSISFGFRVHQDDNAIVLDLTVQDTGPGFDYQRLNIPSPQQNVGDDVPLYYGRGIQLVRTLCRQVVFSGVGNKVWARYLLGELSGEATPQEVETATSFNSASAPDDDITFF